MKTRQGRVQTESVLLSKNQHFFYHIFLKWVRHLFNADVLHVKFHEEKLDRPLVIIANHMSAWDPFLIFSILRKNFVLKHITWRLPSGVSQFQFWHQRKFFKFIGVYSIKNKGDFSRSLKETFNILDKGQNIIFFPEARKVMLNEKVEPKKGISHLIEHKSVYILPIFLEYKRRHKSKKGVKIGKARAVVGDLIKSEYFLQKYDKKERHKAIMGYVYDLEQHLVRRFGGNKN
ncbi:1-acyl-sn-glycerol-3-phosphate acyltransferase [bacterium]|jgi:1-acyl-sn-glycerol-3-phosphate acyltransferase|nr:1-acyl-sn-glycerol-3-phosphate acyltransferase [bacterium]MBT4251093.1 1-acyl-sn-glycerol-3-phosphate acyltransferase [bacterium]MBT4598115.1 1-acyl-sn-glycerol-3-phosphate acyltransferase [bacterium]MBT6753457.1 1-acyl-sn-glycerol-3-phosphate acyltransferase [bacterium]MBT7038170.1 1-acyl-sn-glycerol-3-phosphate acyltransferase [bacterium]